MAPSGHRRRKGRIERASGSFLPFAPPRRPVARAWLPQIRPRREVAAAYQEGESARNKRDGSGTNCALARASASGLGGDQAPVANQAPPRALCPKLCDVKAIVVIIIIIRTILALLLLVATSPRPCGPLVD